MSINKNQKGNYARVNGLDLYYELHGSGQPLVVLPGSFYTIEAMGELVPQLATSVVSLLSSCKDMGTPPTLIARCPSSRWPTISPP